MSLACGLASAVFLIATNASSTARFEALTCHWRVEQRLDSGAGGLSVIGPRSVWVGLFGRGPRAVSLEHWDGSRWSRFVIRSRSFGGIVDAVEASGPDEVWAVGPGSSAARWRNGRVEVVRTPVPDDSRLWALSSTGPDDVWAAGWRVAHGYAGHPLIEHWNGRRWTVSFTEAAFGGIDDVLALSPEDVWAVGWRRVSPRGDPQLIQSQLLHWDGRVWHRQRVPWLVGYGHLASPKLSASGASNIWISVGLHQHRYAFARWNGRRWTFVLGPTVKQSSKALQPAINDLTVVSPTEILAVGAANGYRRGVFLRWDGKRWSPEPAPAVHGWASVEAADGEVWALGDLGFGRTAVAHCTG